MCTEESLASCVKKRTIHFPLEIIGIVIKFLVVITQEFLRQLGLAQ